MRKDIREYIQQNEELKKFVREQPQWYRTLSRNPTEIQKLEVASLHYHKKTIPHHVEKFSNGVQMASMMMSMFQAMNSQS
ncbi:YlbE-like family protein [Cytobacillus sp. FSL W7-1323]|uniref:YlbE-like family protein n=1 Tax=Cytobacillus stercorigallinarum TaxID=2762240 RepID=A0ABR8QNE9_9BACI|nr:MULTISPECIES: YlbE-like family protein [Cytobacillus]MBD7936847.1 YlbE-like family protein [Cytobacillus stercorigallinarum]MCA1027656.1 YlbE-like family protein [Cytobacillus kochii]MCM3321835.1 YlbE-like family protein [Cytobacillus kochii]MCM3343331.1 YlbE-like family protein [Cytobacillus kochii]MDM5207161.1 YlbE-like family protein [Cytobacillus kochii]